MSAETRGRTARSGRFCSAAWLPYGPAPLFLPRPGLISRAGDAIAPKPRWCASCDRLRWSPRPWCFHSPFFPTVRRAIRRSRRPQRSSDSGHPPRTASPAFWFAPPFCPFFSRARLGVILCARRTHARLPASLSLRFAAPPKQSSGQSTLQVARPDSFGPSEKARLGRQNPLAFRVPREKREQKTEDFLCTRIRWI